MKKNIFTKEKGQALPLVVIMIFAIIGIAALAIDAAFTMYDRRQAQNAVDAGALAGARELCKGSANSTVISTANSFASQNKANSPSSTVTNEIVTVTASISNNSFFSKIFGKQTLTAKADASAGCFAPSTGKGVLPVSWSCKAPVGGSDSPDCQLQTLDWETEMKPLVTGSPNPVTIKGYGSVATPMDFTKDALLGQIYIIVDSNKIDEDVSTTCKPTGSLVCDLNGDGVNDVLAGGDRSWLDLNGGGGGAADIKSWVLYGYAPGVSIHTWLAGQSGVDTSIYKAVQDVINRYPPTYPVVEVPVFNGICDQNPNTKPGCETILHNPVPAAENVVTSGGASTYYFHIAGFGTLYLTCVDDGGTNKCPGAKEFLKKNPSLGKIKSIEGYFVSNYPYEAGNSGTGGVDVGQHTVSLTE